MREFIDKNFLLQTPSAQELYHAHAANMPIIDYHCHLNPADIAEDKRFSSITELWLQGDHYKWRAMRANGVEERYCTGDADDWEKFEAWAATVPYTMRNPLYHWTHLELKTAFGITQILKPDTAQQIYDHCNALLAQPAFSAQGLMRRYRVQLVCTTDDPADTLEHHIALRASACPVRVLPTWRPDKALAIEHPKVFRSYVERLSQAAGITIRRFADLIEALRLRHDFFAQVGCRLSDHGMEAFYAVETTPAAVEAVFAKLMDGQTAAHDEAAAYKSAMLYELAVMDWEKGWTQQFHYGALRNVNSRKHQQLGVDTGFDTIGNSADAALLARFLDRLDRADRLTKTILYNLNPVDNAMMAAMTGNFQDGRMAGKIQYGSGWWFLDQKEGITAQLNSLSSMGLLSRFVGMLTDSRSFLSYPRHEYFRRILCNLLGSDMEHGELPASEKDFIGRMVENICYYNALNFFGFDIPDVTKA